MTAQSRISRRKFLGAAGASAAAVAMAACTGGPTPTPQVVEKVVKETQVVEVEKVVVASPPPPKYPAGTLTLWSWGTPQYQEDYMNDFLRTFYPLAGIKASALGTGGAGDIQQKIMLAWAAGCVDCPDFVQSDENAFRPMAKAGALLDLTEWISGIRSKMPDGVFDAYTLEGKTWCFVWRPNTWGMYYNREVFDKAGVKADDIKTWDDWIQAGIEIKNATNGESFLEHRDGGSYWFTVREMVPQAGGRFFDDNGNVVLGSDPKTLEVFQILERMHKAGILYQTTSWNPGWYQAFREGKIAAIHYGNWWDEFLKKNLPDMSGKWGLMAMPAFSNGMHKVPLTGVPFGIINKPKAPYPQLIMELLEWHFLNKERVLEYLHLMTNRGLTAFLPVLKEVYDDPFFQSEDPYYAGQSFQAWVVEHTKGCPPNLPMRPDQAPQVGSIIDAEMGNFYANKQGMEESVKRMVQQITERIEEIRSAP